MDSEAHASFTLRAARGLQLHWWMASFLLHHEWTQGIELHRNHGRLTGRFHGRIVHDECLYLRALALPSTPALPRIPDGAHVLEQNFKVLSCGRGDDLSAVLFSGLLQAAPVIAHPLAHLLIRSCRLMGDAPQSGRIMTSGPAASAVKGARARWRLDSWHQEPSPHYRRRRGRRLGELRYHGLRRAFHDYHGTLHCRLGRRPIIRLLVEQKCRTFVQAKFQSLQIRSANPGYLCGCRYWHRRLFAYLP
jgi:hypothetical protein